ncbi:hypothetical protein M409DRAFT_18607 [Zasmidium cellare ATCC 36951]|uniref:Uncharacterized protein n=1 Tax=Zasmidium cellare ATCC 36951 TaxID=1080233 RepID=A0A6A6CZ67_ZASCE|nr:uncharacterized protein M409DRAFT_18607 [Zasmidium cellare ATCC 36951]KAF2171490.1 hypothetical protein M409DRAFT_18607 [Zasmidium cellare ATCC 36951]
MPTHNLPPDAFQTFSASTPITPALFATALRDLPLETLYARAAELQNSISHLLSSNIQMKPFADAGDADCVDAIRENDEVVRRFEERVGLCREEAERRGLGWSLHGADEEGVTNGEGVNGSGSGNGSGRLSDEELRRRLEAQMVQEEEGEEEDGVYL